MIPAWHQQGSRASPTAGSTYKNTTLPRQEALSCKTLSRASPTEWSTPEVYKNQHFTDKRNRKLTGQSVSYSILSVGGAQNVGPELFETLTLGMHTLNLTKPSPPPPPLTCKVDVRNTASWVAMASRSHNGPNFAWNGGKGGLGRRAVLSTIMSTAAWGHELLQPFQGAAISSNHEVSPRPDKGP